MNSFSCFSFIAAMAAVIPAREAAQREPAEALHYV